MPEVQGQTFPAYEFQAYPKALYRDGKPYDEVGRGVGQEDTRTVSNAEEEAAAIADGFAEASAPPFARATPMAIPQPEPVAAPVAPAAPDVPAADAAPDPAPPVAAAPSPQE